MGEDSVDGGRRLAHFDGDALNGREAVEHGRGDRLGRGLDEPEAPLRQGLGHGPRHGVVADGLRVIVAGAGGAQVQVGDHIDGETLAVTVHPLSLDADADKDVGFAAVVYAAEERAFLVYSQTQRSVWKIDAALTSATRIAAADFDRAGPANGRPKDCAGYARRLQTRID